MTLIRVKLGRADTFMKYLAKHTLFNICRETFNLE